MEVEERIQIVKHFRTNYTRSAMLRSEGRIIEMLASKLKSPREHSIVYNSARASGFEKSDPDLLFFGSGSGDFAAFNALALEVKTEKDHPMRINNRTKDFKITGDSDQWAHAWAQGQRLAMYQDHGALSCFCNGQEGVALLDAYFRTGKLEGYVLRSYKLLTPLYEEKCFTYLEYL